MKRCEDTRWQSLNNEHWVNKEGDLIMSTRYGDRDDRGQRDWGRRSESDDDRAYRDRSRGRSGYGRDEDDREGYGGESRWRGQYGRGGESNRGQYGSGRYSGGGEYGGSQYGGGRSSGGGEYGGDWRLGRQGGGSDWRSGGQYRGREGYRPGSENDWDYTDENRSRYGNVVRGYDTGAYDDTSSGHSQRYNYPTDFRSRESYGERRGGSEYDYGRGGYGEERGWMDRLADRLAAWFGDEDAERRRRMDEQRQYHGKGPKSYRRSDERIREDVNDRLSEGYLDASEIEVQVSEGLVTLTGTVNSRTDKRRAEDIAEDVRGVKNVENRLRVEHSDIDRYPTVTGTSSTAGATGTGASMGTTGTAGTTGTSGTSDLGSATGTSSSGTTGSAGSARGRTAGSQS